MGTMESLKASSNLNSEQDASLEAEPDLAKSEAKFYRSVLLGIVGANCRRYGLSSLEEMVVTNKTISTCINNAARWMMAPPRWHLEGLVELPNPWLIFQMLDWGREPPLPRLF